MGEYVCGTRLLLLTILVSPSMGGSVEYLSLIFRISPFALEVKTRRLVLSLRRTRASRGQVWGRRPERRRAAPAYASTGFQLENCN